MAAKLEWDGGHDYEFRCNNCEFSAWGNYLTGPLPDTDCPKCGFHDSVNETGRTRQTAGHEPLCDDASASGWEPHRKTPEEVQKIIARAALRTT